MTSAERQRAFAARIPGSRFLTVPDADHWVVLERAEHVAELVSRFFTDGRWSAPPRRPRCRHRPVAPLSRSFLHVRRDRPG
ncbi:alpha/beta fold hydrolase [Streptomyces sp. NPDC001739]